jgi:hypothetical protein
VLRIAILVGCWLSFLAVPAVAQTSASFGVGVTIGKKVKPPKSATTVSKLTYTWGAAAISVSEAGYRNIKRQARQGSFYWFTARKGEGQFRIAVSARTGAIVEVIPA